MTFSVVIPTYNRAAFIKKAIESVLQQTFQDFELIIIDDGSTDNTEQVVNSLTDPRIKYIRKKNEERAVARNTGIQTAQGSYISFLDSDDYLFQNHLETANEMIKNHNSPEFFHLGYEMRDLHGQTLKMVNNFSGDINKQLIKGNFLSCNGVFLKREIALNNLFNTDRNLSALEDWELWLRLATKYPLKYSNVVTSIIINHEARSVLTTKKEDLLKRFDALFKYVLSNKDILSYYSGYISLFKSACFSYIALHLALTRNYKSNVLKYLLKALINNPAILLHRTFYATIKYLLLFKQFSNSEDHPYKKFTTIRRIFFSILYFSGIGHLMMRYNRSNLRIPILVFHRISPYSDDFMLPFTPKKFETLLTFLSKKYQFISLNDLFLKSKYDLRKSCIIVFDDAFKDFYDFAIPVIKKMNIPVSMFVPINCINQNDVIWTSRLYNSFKYTSRQELELTINDTRLKFNLRSKKKRIKAAFEVQDILKNQPSALQRSSLVEIEKILGYQNDVNISAMTWPDIHSTMPLIQYESHSMSHSVLSQIEETEMLEFEIYESRKILENQLKAPVDFIAYPMGKYSEKVFQLVRGRYKAGFAVTNKLVELNKVNDDPYKYAIPRFNIYDTNIYELFFKINGFHRIFQTYLWILTFGLLD